MSQTPLDVSGKLHAEPAELDEEEESSDEEPTPKKQKSTRSSKKVSPFLFFGYQWDVIIKWWRLFPLQRDEPRVIEEPDDEPEAEPKKGAKKAAGAFFERMAESKDKSKEKKKKKESKLPAICFF